MTLSLKVTLIEGCNLHITKYHDINEIHRTEYQEMKGLPQVDII